MTANNPINEAITQFIDSQTVLTLATCENNVPVCASCYYAFDAAFGWLVFKSSPNTQHIKNILDNPEVAGSILPDKSTVANIKGIQFSGRACIYSNEFEQGKNLYYNKFPFARAMSGDIWIVELTKIKYTNNTLGFGKKLIWEKYPAKAV